MHFSRSRWIPNRTRLFGSGLEIAAKIQICLENQGYRVITASNAQQALNQLYHQGHLIDLVITDYLMPGMNGIDLLKTIRKDSPTLPVIIMTAYATKNLALEAMKNHCTGFVEKPFKPNQLLDEIERIKTYHYQNEKSDDLDDHLPRIVHQINNPLAVINGTAELILKERPKSEELQNNARNILEAARQIGRINKIIMEADRLDRKKFKPVQIDKLLGNCLDMFTTLFHSKNISVKEKISDHMLCVRGSQFELEQVINNLILNGLEAMEDRPVKRLCITLLPSVDSATLDITIEDTGCGISEELLPNIFKPYVK